MLSDFSIKCFEDLKVTHSTKDICISKHGRGSVEPVPGETNSVYVHLWGIIPAKLRKELNFTAKWFRRSGLDHGRVLMFAESKLYRDIFDHLVDLLLVNQ